MRCLGRLFLVFVLVVAAAAAWLYREDLRRLVDRTLHPAAAAARIGHPSTGAFTSATAKLSLLQRVRQDSVVLSPDEMVALLARNADFLPGVTFDSISIELGDRTVRIRTVVDSAHFPARLRELIPGHRPYEELIVEGTITPIHAGLAEFEPQHVRLRGVPLPSGLVARLAAQLSGRGSEGRLEIVLPQAVAGFRVRPEGVTVYRQGVRQ
jgi:hypothetical protein